MQGTVTAARAAVRSSRGYRLMASTDGGGVNVTAERPQERRTWRASERDGHGPRCRELWELDPLVLLFICVPLFLLFVYLPLSDWYLLVYVD